jgi:hypothetical protein
VDAITSESWRSRISKWPAHRWDILWYFVAAIFAAAVAFGSGEPAQWHWGYLSCLPYLVAAVVSSALRTTKSRAWLLAVVTVAVVLVPLGLESHWRHVGNPRLAQPEVGVIEQSARYVVHGDSPYQAYFHNGHWYGVNPDQPRYESFFPYLPGMAVFGIPSAITHKGLGRTDARIAMSAVTVLLLALAMALWRADGRRKIRVAQVLLTLPTGALFLATGGDDMPILALSLLALVCLVRRWWVAAALILGVACAMKFTAWPLAVALILVARDDRQRRIGLRMGMVATAGGSHRRGALCPARPVGAG